MRSSIAKTAAFTIIAGAVVLPALPAAAAPVTAAATAAASEPAFANFDVEVQAPSRARAGGKLNYTISGVNTGPHSANAWFVIGELPRGVDVRKLRYRSSVKDTQCVTEKTTVVCILPKELQKGDDFTLVLETRVKKYAKGTQKAALGVLTFDVQKGMENLSKEELERWGVPSHVFAKEVKTRLAR
ncbi:hypothetical protein [Nonomuraea longicatena]|uniref:DUF11 domain-containing protein n=1 Tax=Nonomuraea longicatena TaxID=83682 RepID=A0ABP4BSD6_9ACTN